MKNVAVVGCKNLTDFKQWIKKLLRYSKKVEFGKNWVYDVNNDTKYYGVFCSMDIVGRKFDQMIECDPLRLELRLRLGESKNDD